MPELTQQTHTYTVKLIDTHEISFVGKPRDPGAPDANTDCDFYIVARTFVRTETGAPAYDKTPTVRYLAETVVPLLEPHVTAAITAEGLTDNLLTRQKMLLQLIGLCAAREAGFAIPEPYASMMPASLPTYDPSAP
jgi:hypothetical protein